MIGFRSWAAIATLHRKDGGGGTRSVSEPSVCAAVSSAREAPHGRTLRTVLWLSALALPAVVPTVITAQTLPYAEGSSVTVAAAPSKPQNAVYVRPTESQKLRNYVFDAYGPYPVAGALLAAGIGQFSNSPPEWHQGMEGYSKRFASDFGIAAVTTTARYGLSKALREDSLYYRCECQGILPRLKYATFSTLTARRERDGHRVFSLPALLAPYIGATTGTYAWYPNRFGIKDALRTGSYTLLTGVGANVALEFFYSGPHSLLARVHLNNSHGSTDPGPNH